MNSSRRNFIKTSSVLATGLLATPSTFASTSSNITERPLCVFSKCLQFLDYDSMAEIVAKLGFDGVDLPVRRNGQVLPENVAKDLPKVVKAMQREGIQVHMMATDINDPEDQYTEQILGTASDLGIKYYRLGRFSYDLSKPVLENLDQYKRVTERLEKINRKYQIRGEIQNHSGPYRMVGGPVWDLHYLLKDLDPEFIGVQYDIMHATVEGAYSWQYGFHLIKPWIGTLDMKDFIWVKDQSGKYKDQVVPLGNGMVDYHKYLGEIKKIESNKPISIHFEYDLGGAEHGQKKIKISRDEIYKNLKTDLTFMRNALND